VSPGPPWVWRFAFGSGPKSTKIAETPVFGVEVRITVRDQSSDRHEKARILAKGKSIRKNITICPKSTIFLKFRKALRVRSTPFARGSEKTARCSEDCIRR